MNIRSLLLSALLVGGSSTFFVLGASAQAPDDAHPGLVVYRQECASCHDGGNARAPALSILQSITSDDLRYALSDGIMAEQGLGLSAQDRASVIEYLAAAEVTHEAWISDIMCTGDRRLVDLNGPASMRMVGAEITASRMISAEASGLSKGDMGDLELAWALAFPGVTTLRAAPVIVGSTVFYSAVNTRKVLALDAETGCIKWVYDSPNPLRSSVTIAELEDTGRQTLFFGDARGQVHAVDARTGGAVWVTNARVDERGNISGSVVIHDGKVIVPLSASGVSAGANPEFECCVGRGAVKALDAVTGEPLWSYVTMEEAEYTGEVSSTGVALRGPSGAPIWSTPSIDARRGRVYVTTGENTSLPATRTSDAIIALDIETGEELWVFQATPRDVWNMACGRRSGPNCPSAEESIRRDWDFGGSAILTELPNGRELLLAGQKSGHLWALDPEDGNVVWAQRRGRGGALGGNHWGIAIDGERVFLPISDPGAGEDRVPGLYTFDIATGTPLWGHRLSPDCSGDRRERVPQCNSRYGLSAMPLVVDGAVVTAGLDGRVHIFDGVDGSVLFEFDTARPYETINGIEGSGGAVDSHSIAAGAGMIFIGSGYGSFSQPPGNVLLGFRPRSD